MEATFEDLDARFLYGESRGNSRPSTGRSSRPSTGRKSLDDAGHVIEPRRGGFSLLAFPDPPPPSPVSLPAEDGGLAGRGKRRRALFLDGGGHGGRGRLSLDFVRAPGATGRLRLRRSQSLPRLPSHTPTVRTQLLPPPPPPPPPPPQAQENNRFSDISGTEGVARWLEAFDPAEPDSPPGLN